MDKNGNLYFLVFVSLFSASQGESSFTIRGHCLLGYQIGSIFSTDWLGCIEKCNSFADCISYNFNTRRNLCQLNNRGISRSSYVGDRTLNQNDDYIFQQLKTPREQQLAPPRSPICACNCGSEQYCYTQQAPGLGSKNKPASSCKKILSERSDATNGPYYFATFTDPFIVQVYCHMTALPECGGGGWTLVMKIDGTKSTFRYNSTHWTNKMDLDIINGKDMSERETLLPTYWSVTLNRICLGMKYNGLTKWIALNQTGKNLYTVMQTNHTTGLTVSQWKSLLPNSSLETSCTRQGFNVQESDSGAPAARIGILGYSKSDCAGKFSNSRLGFGTSGSSSGMNDANSCGNEARGSYPDNGERSMAAFGYIFVQ